MPQCSKYVSMVHEICQDVYCYAKAVEVVVQDKRKEKNAESRKGLKSLDEPDKPGDPVLPLVSKHVRHPSVGLQAEVGQLVRGIGTPSKLICAITGDHRPTNEGRYVHTSHSFQSLAKVIGINGCNSQVKVGRKDTFFLAIRKETNKQTNSWNGYYPHHTTGACKDSIHLQPSKKGNSSLLHSFMAFFLKHPRWPDQLHDREWGKAS